MTQLDGNSRHTIIDKAIIDLTTFLFHRLATHWVLLIESRAVTDGPEVLYHQLTHPGQDPAVTHGLLRAAEVRNSVEVAFDD